MLGTAVRSVENCHFTVPVFNGTMALITAGAFQTAAADGWYSECLRKLYRKSF